MSTHLILTSEENLELLCSGNEQTEYFDFTVLRQARISNRLLILATTKDVGVAWGNYRLDMSKFYCISILLRAEIEAAQNDSNIDCKMSFYPYQIDGEIGFSAFNSDGFFYDELQADSFHFGMYSECSSQAAIDAECMHIFAFDETGSNWFQDVCNADPARFACVQAMILNSNDLDLPSGRRGHAIAISNFRGLTGSLPEERDEQYERLCFKDPFDIARIAFDNGADPLSFRALRSEIRDLSSSFVKNKIDSYVLSPLLQYIDDLEVYASDVEVLRKMNLATVSFQDKHGQRVLLTPDGLEKWDL